MDMKSSTNAEKWKAYKVLVGMSEGERPLGRPRRWCEDNIKMDIRRKAWGDKD
jgi:hypothetical protein